VGEDFFLRLDAAEFKKPFMQIDLDQFQFFYPVSWDNLKKSEKLSLLKKHLMKFYHEKAVVHLNQRVRILSESTGLIPKRLTFRNQKTRWGSCSSDGSLNLNWKLIAFDESVIDYVIIHELCHLKHPNHSKRFWTLVEAHCPNYKRLNKQLNQAQFEVDFLAAESELYFSNPTLL
jgi:predicted metal-dependent hydrolase